MMTNTLYYKAMLLSSSSETAFLAFLEAVPADALDLACLPVVFLETESPTAISSSELCKVVLE